MATTSIGLSLGGSLPVPNVQALVQANPGGLAVIPDRYVRPEMEQEIVDAAGGDTEEVPVVDLGRLLGDDPDSRAAEAAKLDSACKEWGFFQVVNHGIPAEVMGRMAAAVEVFFAQTLEKKLASSKQPAGSVEGYGQTFVVSEEQKLDWADILYLVTQPPDLRKLDIWPTHPPTFRETLVEYGLEIKRVGLCLLGAMSDNLGLQLGMLADGFVKGIQSVRMNYYPPCRHHADRVLGLSPHSDGSGLTLLLQTSEVPGLQIRRGGRWLAVEPLIGALVINIGDNLEMMTNGRYKSIEHRAVVDPERSRISIATFLHPGRDTVIRPPEDLLVPRPMYKTVTGEEFLTQLFASKLHGKKLLDSMKLHEP